ncbi:NAD(P)/FAD-dependent oxidoreductase [Fimbriiglobus ruber]|uniref:Glycine oxidase ThiO n=1 Tax=Fimbriiglobus ruber TaxID=1908690 RepID=A0A225DH08_9BACT|nr:FAD-dependent oxidoreductase [Fimbriiglobus ruber]OWK40263.1 Glycine oxidase ThiO [Fimbriiglobus ruber]
MGTTPDVLVIGGGIIGLTSAYYLARAGLAVEVVDRAEFGREASWAGAGIIPPGDPARAATPIDQMRAIGSTQFPELSAELREATGIDNGYVRCGGIEFLTPDDLYAVDLWRAEGIHFQQCEGAVAPRVRTPDGTVAYRLDDLAQVRNPRHLRALVAACQKVGVKLVPHTPVAAWERTDSRLHGVRTATGEVKRAGTYLVASGAWSECLLEPLGCRPGICPIRGQIVLFHPPAPLFTRVLMAGKRYLVPRPDGRVLAGSTEEPEAGFEKGNTPEAVHELTEFATGLVPGLKTADIETTWSGLRPGSPDGMPFVGTIPDYPNVLAAVGHARAGVQLSIGTALAIRDLVTGTPPMIPLEAFRPDRVPDPAVRPTFRS